MQKIIYYWDNILGQEELINEYREQLTRLLNGEYSSGLSLDLKQLPGHRIYSIRLNDANRLLFTLITGNDGKNYLVLLEKIANHDYQKSRFLKRSVLKKFLEVQEAGLQQVTAENFQTIDQLPVLSHSDNEKEFIAIKVEYYKDKFIVLNEEQADAIKHYHTLPLIVSGPPGAGKSCVALNILEQCYEHYPESEKPILFITKHRSLSTNLEAIFTTTHPEMNPKLIQFRTYNELLAEFTGHNDFLDIEDFRAWFKKFLERSKHFPFQLENADAIYNEFCIINVYADKYLTLGVRESVFSDKQERQLLLGAYQEYQKHLGDRINADFYDLSQRSHYSCIITDETQNFSPRQLQVLIALADGKNCFCLDTNQTIHDVQSKYSFLTKLFHELGIKLEQKKLPVAYRCSKQVTEAVNTLLQLKYRVTGGKIDKQQYGLIALAQAQTKQGSVHWWDTITPSNHDFLNKFRESAGFAIVTSAEYVEEARKELVDTPLILTYEEAAGLEFETIIAYQIFESDEFKLVNERLDKSNAQAKTEIHRAKDKESNDRNFGPCFNRAFIAFSRACENLIIYQKPKQQLRHIIEPLKAITSQKLAQDAISVSKTSTADWKEQRDLLLAHGHHKQAKLIEDKLGESEQKSVATVTTEMCSSSSTPRTATTSTTPKNSTESQSTKKKKKQPPQPTTHTKVITTVLTKDEQFRQAEHELRPNNIIDRKKFLARYPEVLSDCRLLSKLIDRILPFPDSFDFIFRNKIKDGECLFDIYIRTAEHISAFFAYFGKMFFHTDWCKSGFKLPFEGALKHKWITDELKKSDIGKLLLRLLTLHEEDKSATNTASSKLRPYLNMCTTIFENAVMKKITFVHLEQIFVASQRQTGAWLLEAPTNDPEYRTEGILLQRAAMLGDLELVELFLKYHPKIDIVIKDVSALEIAVYKQHLPVIQLLLKRGAFPHTPFENSPLAIAINKAPVNGFAALDLLLSSPLIRVNKLGVNILFAAVRSTVCQELLPKLVRAGCDPKQIHPEQGTALFPAVARGDVGTVRYLIEQGCDPNTPDSYGETPLLVAIYKGNIEMVKALLPHTAQSLRDLRYNVVHPSQLYKDLELALRLYNAASRYRVIDEKVTFAPDLLAKDLGYPELAALLFQHQLSLDRAYLNRNNFFSENQNTTAASNTLEEPSKKSAPSSN